MERTLLHYTEKIKKPLHILTAFAVIICTAFTFPSLSFATSQNTYNLAKNVFDFTATSLDSYSGRSYGRIHYTLDNLDTDISINIVKKDIPLEDTYVFNYGNYCYPVFVSETSFQIPSSTVYVYFRETGSFSSGRTNMSVNATYDNTTQLYYASAFSNSYYEVLNLNVPVFSTIDDGLADVREFIDNGGPAPSGPAWVNKPLVIPQGYTAVINTTNMTAGNGGFRLRANTGNLGNSNLWRDIFGNDNVQSGQAIYNTNTPVSSYDFDDYPQLTWNPYEYSLLRATAYEYVGEATKANTYTYIFNPIQGNATSIKNGQNTNSYITLYMNEDFDGTVKLYPLTSMAAVGQGQTIDVGNDDSENAGSGDISNGTWTNGDGNVFTPPQGGGNGTGSSQNPLESIAGTVEHLGEVLNQFVAGLSTILTAPVEAIQTLINNGSAFVSQLSGLYSWLPTQVYSTLTSAIILCITVGVLKVLL